MKIPMVLLPHRVTIIPFKGSGAYGPKWETDETKFRKNVPCRIDPKTRKITGSNGSDVVQRADGLFQPDVGLKVGDKIRWELNGAEYAVEEWTPIDMMGPYSVEAVLS
jgi:hypothetical protein